MLTEVTLQEAAEGKVFVQVRPVQSKRRKLDVIELFLGPAGKSRILRHGKLDLRPALHRDDDRTFAEAGGASRVTQGVHATSVL